MSRVTLTLFGVVACGRVEGEPITLMQDRAESLMAGLVGHWKLDEEGDTTTVLDASGHQHHGRAIGGPRPSAVSAPLRAPNPASRVFDGQSQYLDLGNPARMNIEGRITMAAWVKTTSIDHGCAAVLVHGYRSDPDAEVFLRLGSDVCVANREQRWAVGRWQGTSTFADTPWRAEDLGVWLHLAGVFDGNAWILYRNGVPVARQASTRGPPRMDAPWAIGGRAQTSLARAERFWNGHIDDVRLYDRALSPSEIQALYQR